MERKDIVVDKLLCMACLCIGRTLYEISDQRMQHYYLKTLSEIPLCNVPQVCPSICWECTALLKKAVLFLEQVKDSYRILQTYTSETFRECLLTDITRLPRFKTHHNDSVSIPPESDSTEHSKRGSDSVSVPPSDSQVIDIEVVKEENDVQLVCVKEENHDWCGDLDDIFSNNNRSPSIIEENKDDLEKNIDSLSNKKDKRALKSPVLNDEEISKIEIEINTKKEKRKRKKSPLISTGDETEIEKDRSMAAVKKEKRCKKKKDEKVQKTKKLKRELKRSKTDNKNAKAEAGQKILTIELSYEEMLQEREKDSMKESYIKAEFKCETCLIGFNYAKSYESHFKTKHSPNLGNYSCPICKTVIASVESFTSHYKRHMRRYECSICQKRTMDMKVMQQHYYATHEIQLSEYKCQICGKISNSIDTHRYHKDTHKARIQCKECDKTFCHRAGLLNHRLAVHEFHNDFPCSVCGKTFRWKSSLKRHIEKHYSKDKQGVPAAFCSPCGIGFSSVSSYQRHLRNSLKHVSQYQLKFICDHCNRRFADKTKLRDHIEEKHLHRTYQCHICSKPSKNRVGLDQHIRNVHKGRPNNKVCHFCGKAFPTKVQLESHIRTHTGERPFICEICPTTFSQQSNLYKHNRQVHLNIKPKRYPLTKKGKEAPEPPAEPQPYNSKPLLYFSPDRSFM